MMTGGWFAGETCPDPALKGSPRGSEPPIAIHLLNAQARRMDWHGNRQR